MKVGKLKKIYRGYIAYCAVYVVCLWGNRCSCRCGLCDDCMGVDRIYAADRIWKIRKINSPRRFILPIWK